MRYITWILLVAVLLLSGMARANGPYEVTWYTIDGGGGTSSGGQYSVTGTIGQADAGYHDGDDMELLGGFWVGGPLCIVNLQDFAAFAAYWLDGPCNETNNDCNGANLDGQEGSDVTINDLTILVNQWLNVCPFAWPL